MNNWNRIASLTVIVAVAQLSCAQAPTPIDHRASSRVIDYWVSLEEQKLVGVANAMPADKYAFTPAGREFAGVRSFADQLKHLSATNFILGAAILGQAPPSDAGDETGPSSLRTKADVVRYLKDSFACLHKAVATIDNANEVIASAPISPMPKGSATRLGYAVEVLTHISDLNLNNWAYDATRSLDSCEFQHDRGAHEVHTQWVRNKISHFNSPSTPR